VTNSIAAQLRQLRVKAGLSLSDVGKLTNGRFPAAVVGSYERGTRDAPLSKALELLTFYGYTLRVEPLDVAS
jgi:transcriptional regulator with XRE-family HTH domain